MFLQVCVILFTGGEYTPRTRYTPQDQVPPGPGTTPPPEQVPPAWDQVPPPDQVHHHPQTKDPPDQVHPPTPGAVQSMLGDTVNVRAVRILLECNLVSKPIEILRFAPPLPHTLLVSVKKS